MVIHIIRIKLLKQGCLNIIDSGRSTKVLKDTWILSNPPRSAEPRGVDNKMLVTELIKTHGRRMLWNGDTLEAALSNEDKELVRRIYLAQREE